MWICDGRRANKAITRERYPMPTIDDLIHTLNGAMVFSKLDLRSGYHQLTLAPESRYITTFATHLLTSTAVMAYFDPSKETELVTDASPSGLSAILMQTTPRTGDK